MARREELALNSLTLLAAQTDFTEAGELTLFIDDSQLNYLEDIMWDQGYLDTRQMAGAFQLLRSNDLIWSAFAHEYLMGRRSPMIDLMAWNADATRMPYRMHSEYLRRLFLTTIFSKGAIEVRTADRARGHPRADVRRRHRDGTTSRPGARSTRSICQDTDVTFVLTSGGHNAGIVSEPGHKGRHYRISQRAADARYTDPETWYAVTKIEQGSWWQAWLSWLERLSHRRRNAPPVRRSRGRLSTTRTGTRQIRFGALTIATAREWR